jgi:hypothetical protein
MGSKTTHLLSTNKIGVFSLEPKETQIMSLFYNMPN